MGHEGASQRAGIVVDSPAEVDPTLAVLAWLAAFEDALRRADAGDVSSLIADDSYWRDVLALTWQWGSVGGPDEIAAALVGLGAGRVPRSLELAAGYTPPSRIQRVEGLVIEAFAEFETDQVRGKMVIRLLPDSASPVGFSASTLLTKLDDLKGDLGWDRGRHKGIGYDREYPTQNWPEHRADMLRRFETEDPEVLVIGGGHSGLVIAAHLQRLGISVLVVERNDRLGDNWRNRYDSLALHTLTDLSHLPDIPFPPHYPDYIPKEVLANWIEFYGEAMEVPVWLSSEFLTGSYDEAVGRWAGTVRRADGSERVLRPRQIVVATGGLGGTAYVPKLAGLDEFTGEAYHGEKFRSAAPYAGKDVMVVGTGTSAFDIALSLYNAGAKSVSILQRGPTIVTKIESSSSLFEDFRDPTRTIEEKDLINYANFVLPRMLTALRPVTKAIAEQEREMLDALAAVGLRLHHGDDDAGYLIQSLRTGGPYYLDVGAVDVVLAGGITIRHAEDLERFDATGAVMTDGTHLPLDLVVLCTGYHNLVEDARTFFGDEIAELLGPTFTLLDETGEMAHSWSPTPQPGLTFMPGGIGQTRPNVVPFALLIKAMLEGVAPLTASREGAGAQSER